MGKNYLHIELAFNLAQNGIAKNILAVLTTSNRKQVQFNCRTIYILYCILGWSVEFFFDRTEQGK